MSLNNTLTNEDLMGLYKVNNNAVMKNVLTYGQGNRNTSPTITSPRLNNLPSKGNMPNPNNYNVPPPVPKLKMPPLIPVKKNNKTQNSAPAPTKLKQNRKSRKNRKNRKASHKNRRN